MQDKTVVRYAAQKIHKAAGQKQQHVKVPTEQKTAGQQQQHVKVPNEQKTAGQ